MNIGWVLHLSQGLITFLGTLPWFLYLTPLDADSSPHDGRLSQWSCCGHHCLLYSNFLFLTCFMFWCFVCIWKFLMQSMVSVCQSLVFMPRSAIWYFFIFFWIEALVWLILFQIGDQTYWSIVVRDDFSTLLTFSAIICNYLAFVHFSWLVNVVCYC